MGLLRALKCVEVLRSMVLFNGKAWSAPLDTVMLQKIYTQQEYFFLSLYCSICFGLHYLCEKEIQKYQVGCRFAVQ